ncbi:MAG: cupin domain-containing protein [Pseudobdellovibrio sp.]
MIKKKQQILFDKTFWSQFVKKTWQKKPAIYKNVTASILEIDADQVFKWLVGYSDYCRKTKTSEGLKFFINGESQYQSELLQVLPIKKDKSLLGYHQRMQKLFTDYCLVCDELIQVSQDRWSVLSDFTQGLYQFVGIPNRQSEIGLYLGNYKKTPFGVHVDGCGVFSIPIVGEKRFRIWEPAYVKKNPDLQLAFDYQSYLKESTLFKLNPGDISYWPSTSWHIAESDGSFSATWSLGIWVDQPYIEILMQTIQPLLNEKLLADADEKYIKFKKTKNANGLVETIPGIFKRSVNQIKSLSLNELNDLFMKQWLVLQSKNGFKSAIKPNTKLVLRRQDLDKCKLQNPIIWAKLHDNNLCLASHGKLMYLPNTISNIEFIKSLNTENIINSALFKKNKHCTEIFKILQNLFQSGQLLK